MLVVPLDLVRKVKLVRAGEVGLVSSNICATFRSSRRQPQPHTSGMSPDDDAEETELRDMNRGDDNDRSDPNAPLLPSDAAAVNSPSHGDVGRSSTGLDTDFSGGWFIWALTFSAGISGLLFGYE